MVVVLIMMMVVIIIAIMMMEMMMMMVVVMIMIGIMIMIMIMIPVLTCVMDPVQTDPMYGSTGSATSETPMVDSRLLHTPPVVVLVAIERGVEVKSKVAILLSSSAIFG